MAKENEHIKKLIAAQEKAIEQRRVVADSLAKKYKGGHTEEMHERFISIQNTIEAIQRAITHERILTGGDWNPKTYPNPSILGRAGPGPL